MRLVDRVLRPLFPDDYHAETQVMIQLMSHDDNVMPDALAGLAASAALAVSDIPFYNLISEVRVARVNGKFVINPSREELEQSDIDMMIGASKDSVAMVEGEMKEISEAEMVEAIKFAHEAIKIQIEAQERLRAAVGSPAYREYEPEKEDESVYAKVKAAFTINIMQLLKKHLQKAKEEKNLLLLKKKLKHYSQKKNMQKIQI